MAPPATDDTGAQPGGPGGGGAGDDDHAIGPVELIAHRAGNRAGGVAEVRYLADTIELDVRWQRREMVVRHARRVWFTNRLWEREGLRAHLLAPDHPVLDFAEAVAEVDDDLGLWIDCKGISPRLPPETLAVAGVRDRLTVSTKAWWMLAPVDDRPGVRAIRSVSNRFELFLLRFLPSRVELDGVVLHSRLLEGRLVSDLKRRYGSVFSWSIPDVATGQRLAEWGVDGLIIDEPDVLSGLRHLSKRGSTDR